MKTSERLMTGLSAFFAPNLRKKRKS